MKTIEAKGNSFCLEIALLYPFPIASFLQCVFLIRLADFTVLKQRKSGKILIKKINLEPKLTTKS